MAARNEPDTVEDPQAAARGLRVQRFRLTVQRGPDDGVSLEFGSQRVRIGARRGNDMTLTDRKVSGVHLEIIPDDRGFRARDLDSTNGTIVDGVRLLDGYLPPRAIIQIGDTRMLFEPMPEADRLDIAPLNRFGRLIGVSNVMRRMFLEVARVAATPSTVLISGETGTGKELVAEAIHEASDRAQGPFVVIDCGAIPANLFESELFGHERGAFTGAERSVAGAVERANGGTLFLDEIGELPLDQQAKLLRVVQERRVRRLGSEREVESDFRILAATNRDLAREVNRGVFREDLYYRLAVVQIQVAPLRERRDDIMPLVRHLLDERDAGDLPLAAEVEARLLAHYWPGNVRELCNVVERLILAPHLLTLGDARATGTSSGGGGGLRLELELDLARPFKDEKQRVVDEFDRRFVKALLARHGGNMAAAARAAGIDRVSLYKVMSRIGMERD